MIVLALKKKKGVIADINVTNLVDVTMVLLIVFILIAPVIETGVDLNLPVATSQKIDTPQNMITVSVSKVGVIFWNRDKVELEELAQRIIEEKRKNPNPAILLRGDTDASYGQMVKVLDVLRNMGISQIDIATQTETK